MTFPRGRVLFGQQQHAAAARTYFIEQERSFTGTSVNTNCRVGDDGRVPAIIAVGVSCWA
ncbi:MAG: hypothetical protein GY722_04450 [bacterium]|nr:hypothetical protein [bacterium]